MKLPVMKLPLIVPLSLYIHIPWCVKKCPYCDFNSHQLHSGIPEEKYVQALISDIEQDLPLVWGRPVESVFIGGGTPSLLTAAALGELMGALRARLPIKPNAEITMEANPGTVEQNKFSAFFELGINRLSIGVQSFNDPHLKRLGRIHDAMQALRAIETAQKAGFENINIDLMFALPEQSVKNAAADLKTALAAGVSHISYYQLTLEPNTAFFNQPPPMPNDDLAAEIQQQGHDLLNRQGYQQYEVSAFSLPGKQCRHNINYWQFGDYLAIGAGAHAKISDLANAKITRFLKLRHPTQYMQQAGNAKSIQQTRTLHKSDRILEFVMNAFRLSNGFREDKFEQTTGLPIEVIEESMQQANLRGFIHRENGVIKTSARGGQFLNDVLQLFMDIE